MKKTLLTVILSFFLMALVLAEENSDCNDFDKLSKKYAICVKKNMEEKIKTSKPAKKFNKFKESKTLFDLFKKN